MKKAEQLAINSLCETEFSQAMHEFRTWHTPFQRLRSCTADWCETDNYRILRSYNTYVGVINLRTHTLYDVLRHNYGYTATSAQHISKFNKDYAMSIFNAWNIQQYTWRDC